MERSLWSRNFCLVTLATALGAVGSIAGGFALSFFVFDETGSTFASAFVLAVQMVPHVLLPLAVAPWMDRLPRKAFLVGGDAANGIVYGAMGLWLLFCPFSYAGYLGISLLLACLESVDELAYTSIYPDLIPEGMEEKGYAVSSMLYPVLRVVLMPLSAVLLDVLGVASLLLIQSGLSLAAAFLEGQIRMGQTAPKAAAPYSFHAWREDIREAACYLRGEPGLRAIYGYMAVTNGISDGYAPILVAFFRTMPGMTAAMYSFFSVAGKRAAVSGQNPGGQEVFFCVFCVPGLRGYGYVPFMAALSVDACKPGALRVFGEQQRDFAVRGGAAVYSGASAFAGECV